MSRPERINGLTVESRLLSNLEAVILNQPIKDLTGESIAADKLYAQAGVVISGLRLVDFYSVRGTCVDERLRGRLLNGQDTGPRPAVPGGPDIWGLALAELIGLPLAASTGQERLAIVSHSLKAANIKSGGHLKCAANDGLLVWMAYIRDNPDQVKAFARSQLDQKYDEGMADTVVDQAANLLAGTVYKGWSEKILGEVLAAEAGEAIEQLADGVEHQAQTIFRIKVPNLAADVSWIYRHSIIGPGSYIMNDPYSSLIENVLTSGPDAVRLTALARHAREIALGAVAMVVPNKLLYQGDIVQIGHALQNDTDTLR